MACDQCLFQMDTQSELSGFSARSQPTLTRFSVHCSLFTFYCSRGTITVPRGLRPRVRPRHDRAILASPPSAVFDERGPKHDPAVPAAAACSPDRKVREVEARGRAISSAGATGKGETIGDSIFGPNQWLYRTANGDIQFLSVSWALPLFRRRCRGFPCLSKNIRPPGPLGPGYMPRPLTRPGRGSERYDSMDRADSAGRGSERSDPMDRVDSAGRVRRTRPTAESEAAANRRTPHSRGDTKPLTAPR